MRNAMTLRADRRITFLGIVRRARWLALVAVVVAGLGPAQPGAASETSVANARAPVIIEVRPGTVRDIVTMTPVQRARVAIRIAREAGASIESADGRIAALAVKGVPVTSVGLNRRQLRAIEAELSDGGNAPTRDELAERYDRHMSSILARALRELNRRHRDAQVTVYGLPAERTEGAPAAVRSANQRFRRVIDRSSVLLPGRQFLLLGKDAAQMESIRSGMPETLKSAEGRPVLFRANGQWRSLGGEAEGRRDDAHASAGHGGTETLVEYARQNRGEEGAGGPGDNQDGTFGGGGRDGGLGGGGGDDDPTGPEALLADVEIRRENGRIEMRDAETGQILLDPRALPLHVQGESDAVVPLVQVDSTYGGFDLVYQFYNTSNHPRPLGILSLGIFTLGENIITHDFRLDGAPVTADFNGPVQYGGATIYPEKIYSPVGVIRNDDYAIGISLHYPVLEYKHDVEWFLWSPTNGSNDQGEGGRGWAFKWKLSNMGTERDGAELQYPAMLQPGEAREYRVSVRVTKDSDDWLRTLLPYRDYFYELYGPVTYERDPNPVAHVVVAGEWNLDEDNYFGLQGPNMRPDIHGWRPWADRLRGLYGTWKRAVLWKPTGVYQNHDEVSNPYLFTSNWMTEGHNMGDAVEQLSTVPTTNFELGLWWGRAALVTPHWNPSPEDLEGMDPENPDHVARGFTELDLAVESGATMVGLDDYMHSRSPIWKLYPWLKMMQQRHPHVRFVAETRQPDFMHRIAPTFLRATNRFFEGETDRRDDVFNVSTPMYLADFLLPGHEIWGHLSGEDLEPWLGHYPSPEEMRREVNRIAAMGYVPVIDLEFPPDESSVAAESWLETIPEDLLLDVPDF